MAEIRINEEKCISCGTCIDECEHHVIEIKEDKACIVHPMICMFCLNCMLCCPVEAIYIV